MSSRRYFLFNTRSLAQPEKEVVYHLSATLSGLQTTVSQFRSCVRLAEACRASVKAAMQQAQAAGQNTDATTEKMRESAHWSTIAACSAAMEIHQFGIYLDEVFRVADLCPTIWEAVNKRDAGDAAKIFRKAFPDAVSIRNGVAHAPELAAKMNFQRKNEVKMTFGPQVIMATITPTFDGRMLTLTWKNKQFQIEISENTAQVMDTTETRLYEVFAAAAAKLENG